MIHPQTTMQKGMVVMIIPKLRYKRNGNYDDPQITIQKGMDVETLKTIRKVEKVEGKHLLRAHGE